jgi:DNA-binding NarL/FixJ family response regulator
MSDRPRVLAVSDDAELLRVAEAAVLAGEGSAVGAPSVARALEELARGPVSLAIVDGRTQGALSLVHHVRTLCETATVVVAVDTDDAPMMRAALDLGADGLVTTPLHGDAVLRALSKARIEGSSAERALALTARAERAVATARALRRMVEAAAEGDDELVGAALDALTDLAPTVTARVSRTSPADEPITAVSGDTERFLLGEQGREIGTLSITGGDAPSRASALEVASVLSSLFSLRGRLATTGGARSRVLDRNAFDDVLTREVEKATRHRRALSLLTFDSAGTDVPKLADHLRGSDVVGRSDREVFVLLPETNFVGAAQLRRRIGHRPTGAASVSRDGASRDALIHTARARRERMRTSPLLGLAGELDAGARGSPALAPLVRKLLVQPLHDAGALSSYPLLLGLAPACSLVKHACLEASRRGESVVHVTAGPFAVAAREAATEREPAPAIVEHAALDPLFAVAVTGELGSWACAGRFEGEGITALHGADPLLTDWIIAALEHAPS